MESPGSPAIARLVAQATSDPDVLAVILFGSRARGEASAASDYDVCLVLTAPTRSDLEAGHKRLGYLARGDLDVVLFHQLPLHVRSRVLRDGRVLFTRDEDALYAVAVRTARAFEGFATSTRGTSTPSPVVDRERVLAKLDELDGYLRELRSVAPERFEEYLAVEKRRACERLLQVSVEAVIDICAVLVTGLRLGLPAEEDDLFAKLTQRGVVSAAMAETLRRMKGLRNLLVHEYGRINDQLVFETLQKRLGDFDTFKAEVLAFLRESPGPEVAPVGEQVPDRAPLGRR